ncbi:hypothetical protein Micbo1qcDRAFT_180023 [Microdochium bolleyi]|uniref:Uncharacterized protein n=1 Tax=Microdochium bolleyi TaxID=196109 RepID=A0A136IMR9_9PEZI|nr:hypothetical protein Micbo1qcDRAFT_180023 [Microdochium bolleyi]
MYGYQPRPGIAPALADPARDPKYDHNGLRAPAPARFRRDPEPMRTLHISLCQISLRQILRLGSARHPLSRNGGVSHFVICQKDTGKLPKGDWEIDLAPVPDHCDTLLGQALKALFQNDILDGKANLGSDTPSQVREYFKRWRLPLGEDNPTPRKGPRCQT